MTTIVCQAPDSSGRLLRLRYARTCNWKAFSVEGLPRSMRALENTRQSLAGAVAAWNRAARDPAVRLDLAAVSERIKALSGAQ